MNKLHGHIEDIQVSGSLSLVSIRLSETVLIKTIVIETPETVSYLKIGNTINALFKETEVVIGKDATHQISLQNQIRATVLHLERGTLISNLALKTELGELNAIISTAAVDSLDIKESSVVLAMVKLNEIMLSE